MTTTLAIPKKIATHQPKPTKSQLVEALVARARIAHDKENEARRLKREAIEAKIRAEATELFRSSGIENFGFLIEPYQKRCSFKITFDNAAITKMITEAAKYNWLNFDRDETKRKIVESLKTPNPLLESNDTAKALDQLLERIMNIKPAIEA